MKRDWTQQAQTCGHCNRREFSPGAFKRCARCRLIYYCKKSCQTKDWKLHHKSVCTPWDPEKVKNENIKSYTNIKKKNRFVFLRTCNVIHAQLYTINIFRANDCSDFFSVRKIIDTEKEY